MLQSFYRIHIAFYYSCLRNFTKYLFKILARLQKVYIIVPNFRDTRRNFSNRNFENTKYYRAHVTVKTQ